jgi:hypothetical protein
MGSFITDWFKHSICLTVNPEPNSRLILSV